MSASTAEISTSTKAPCSGILSTNVGNSPVSSARTVCTEPIRSTICCCTSDICTKICRRRWISCRNDRRRRHPQSTRGNPSWTLRPKAKKNKEVWRAS